MGLSYEYYLATATVNNLFNAERLHFEIEGSGAFPGIFVGVRLEDDGDGDSSRDLAIVMFTRPLDPITEKPVLDSIVAQHTGEQVPSPKFLGATKLVENEIEIVNDTEWQQLGGVVSHPAFFAGDLNRVVGQIMGSCLCIGSPIELKVTEEALDGTVRDIIAPFVPQNSAAGKWEMFNKLSNVPPRDGYQTYVLWARLNGAVSGKIRFTTMTMLEML